MREKQIAVTAKTNRSDQLSMDLVLLFVNYNNIYCNIHSPEYPRTVFLVLLPPRTPVVLADELLLVLVHVVRARLVLVLLGQFPPRRVVGPVQHRISTAVLVAMLQRLMATTTSRPICTDHGRRILGRGRRCGRRILGGGRNHRIDWRRGRWLLLGWHTGPAVAAASLIGIVGVVCCCCGRTRI